MEVIDLRVTSDGEKIAILDSPMGVHMRNSMFMGEGVLTFTADEHETVMNLRGFGVVNLDDDRILTGVLVDHIKYEIFEGRYAGMAEIRFMEVRDRIDLL